MSDIATEIAQARREPTTRNLERMWRRVVALPAWFLLPASDATPAVLRDDSGTWLVVFTHFRPLNQFARSHGLLVPDSNEIEMRTMSPRDALARVDTVAIHIDGLTFNPTTDVSFRAPLAMLETLRELLPPRPQNG